GLKTPIGALIVELRESPAAQPTGFERVCAMDVVASGQGWRNGRGRSPGVPLSSGTIKPFLRLLSSDTAPADVFPAPASYSFAILDHSQQHPLRIPAR